MKVMFWAGMIAVSTLLVLPVSTGWSPSISAQAEAVCEPPSVPLNVGIGSDGLKLQISWERGEGGPAPDGYVVAVKRSIGHRGNYYEDAARRRPVDKALQSPRLVQHQIPRLDDDGRGQSHPACVHGTHLRQPQGRAGDGQTRRWA